MPERGKKFHDFALQSTLFKGRSDWYFCYLKAEKIGHVLTLLAQSAEPTRRDDIEVVARRSGGLCGEIAHLAAGELDASIVLADIFALLSAVRMLVSQDSLNADNGFILVQELEQVAERLARGSHPSPFVTTDDFGVPPLAVQPALLPPTTFSLGQGPASRLAGAQGQSKGQSERMSLILDLVRKKKSLSIKEIARVIKDCSEKTIQRELAALISQGLVRKVGERRWSLYLPA